MPYPPWAIISTPEPVNLKNIMLEEVIKELQLEENKSAKPSVMTSTAEKYNIISEETPAHLDGENDLTSDALIARLLQQQFDEECNRSKISCNKTLKIPISFTEDLPNLHVESESEDEKTEDFLDHKDWDQSNTVKKEITKHDIIVNNQNGAEFDVKSGSNKKRNSLRLHWKPDQTIREFSLDEYSTVQLDKMIKNKMLKRVNHVINTGKGAVIFHAECNSTHRSKECVLKVSTLTKSEFNERVKDIAKNECLAKTVISRRNLNSCVEKEMVNLLRLKKAGILCPEVIGLKKNVLIMSFIGENCFCAPKLKDAILTADEYVSAYHQVVEAMKVLYTKARLIHANLSEYNILWHNEQCYFIDLSQALDPSHWGAFYLLMRDCINITKFFITERVPDIMAPEELFTKITGFDYNDRIAMEETFKETQTIHIQSCLAKTDINTHDLLATT